MGAHTTHGWCSVCLDLRWLWLCGRFRANKLLLLLLIDLQPLARTYQLVDDLGLHRPTILAREFEHLAGTQTSPV